MLARKKNILVTNANTMQGASVAKHLLADKHFSVRCISDDSHSYLIAELENAGAEIVAGDIDNMDSLLAAMQDVDAVFACADCNDDFEKTYQQGKNLFDAAAFCKPGHFIYSSLPLPHTDNRPTLQAYARKQKLNISFVHVSGYYENFLSCYLPQKMEDNNYYLYMPDENTQYATISIHDFGGIVRAMFRFPEVYIGRTVCATGTDMSFTEYAAALSKIVRIKIICKPISTDDDTNYCFQENNALSDMVVYNKLHTRYRPVDIIESYGLYPSMQTFESWVMNQKKCIHRLLLQQQEATAYNF